MTTTHADPDRGTGAARPRALRPPADGRHRLSTDLLAVLAARLTARDRWLLGMLAEHRVLTTAQITELAFGGHRRALVRLTELWRLHAVDRFRPFTEVGSAPWHYVLGPAGTAVLTADTTAPARPGRWHRGEPLAIAHSAMLAHTVGANGVFTALATAARRTPNARLAVWWSERRAAAAWGDLARPDGYGRWDQDGRSVDFFVEYDTGSEQLAKVAAKLGGYAALADATGLHTPVLFWLPNPTRETGLRRLLTDPGTPVATTTPTAVTRAGGAGPAGPVWLPAGASTRVGLVHLTAPTQTPAPLGPAPGPRPTPAGPSRATWAAPSPTPPAPTSRRPTPRPRSGR